MRKIFTYQGMILLCAFSLNACATSPDNLRSNVASEEIAKTSSCEEISQKIAKLDKILESVSPSETEKLYKDTAMSAVKTGVSLSGILGAAGPLASLGVNFMEGLYKINTKNRQAAIKQAAEEEKFIMWDAYYLKECRN